MGRLFDQYNELGEDPDIVLLAQEYETAADRQARAGWAVDRFAPDIEVLDTIARGVVGKVNRVGQKRNRLSAALAETGLESFQPESHPDIELAAQGIVLRHRELRRQNGDQDWFK